MLDNYKFNPNIANTAIPIWHNKGVVIDQNLQSLFSDSKVYFIQELLHNGIVLERDNMQHLSNKNLSWLDYIKIKTPLQHYVKKMENFFQQRTSTPLLPMNLLPIIKNKRGSKVFYNILQKHDLNFKAADKWNMDLNVILTTENWRSIFRIAYFTIPDNQFRWFQFKIIHRILGTRDLLLKMKISESNLCGLCNLYPETLKHLFSECCKSNFFWNQLIMRITSKINNLPFTSLTKIFGFLNTCNNQEALNTILTVARYFIFVNSKNKSTLYYNDFVKLLNKVYKEQELLSKLGGKSDLFYTKWSILKDIVLL